MFYFDNNASTFTDPEIANKINKLISSAEYGNPSSNHVHGWKAHEIYHDCQEDISRIFNALPEDVIFTSGATEANNLAIGGLIQSAYIQKTVRTTIIVSEIEHKCILNTSKYFCDLFKFNLIVLPVLPNGIVDLDKLESLLSDQVLVVSVMTTNNEIGTIQPIKAIGLLCKKYGAIFHTDMAQAYYKNVDMISSGIDMISLSGHKIYGPTGIGALLIDSKIKIKPQPILHGGLQQGMYRSGSIPIHLCKGLSLALTKINSLMDSESFFLSEMRNYFLKSLTKTGIEFVVNGDMNSRHPGNLNVSFRNINNDLLIQYLSPFASLSTGSACNAGVIENSYVLKALNLEDWQIQSAIRLCFGRYNTLSEVDFLINKLEESIETIKRNT